MRCTQDDSLGDAISHYKQTPSIATGDTYRLSLSDNFKGDIAIVPL
jgi:hypothetical protein